MKVNIDLENLESSIKGTLEKNIETIIQTEIKEIAKEYVESNCEEAIQEIVGEQLKKYIDDYIHTHKITIGGGLYDDEEKKISIADYTRKTISELLDKKIFTYKSKDSWSGRETIKERSFDDYIKDELKYEYIVEAELKKYITSVKNEINRNIKETFDNQTKQALSESVFGILMSTDTYKTLVSNIQLLAGQNND